MKSARLFRKAVAVASVFLASCSSDDVLRPKGRTSVSNATAAASHVAFMAPLGTSTGVANDASATPEVRICIWQNNACAGAPVQKFSLASGLTLNADQGAFTASWSIISTTLTTRRTYQIGVYLNDILDGSIYVDVVRGRWALRIPGSVDLPALTSGNAITIEFGVAQGGADAYVRNAIYGSPTDARLAKMTLNDGTEMVILGTKDSHGIPLGISRIVKRTASATASVNYAEDGIISSIQINDESMSFVVLGNGKMRFTFTSPRLTSPVSAVVDVPTNAGMTRDMGMRALGKTVSLQDGDNTHVGFLNTTCGGTPANVDNKPALVRFDRARRGPGSQQFPDGLPFHQDIGSVSPFGIGEYLYVFDDDYVLVPIEVQKAKILEDLAHLCNIGSFVDAAFKAVVELKIITIVADSFLAEAAGLLLSACVGYQFGLTVTDWIIPDSWLRSDPEPIRSEYLVATAWLDGHPISVTSPMATQSDRPTIDIDFPADICPMAIKATPNPVIVFVGESETVETAVVNDRGVALPGRDVNWKNDQNQDIAVLNTVGNFVTIFGKSVGHTETTLTYRELSQNRELSLTLPITVVCRPDDPKCCPPTDAKCCPPGQTCCPPGKDCSDKPNPPDPAGGNSGGFWGDPHYTSIDGLRFNFQAVGTFILSKSTVVGDDFEVQVRNARCGGSVSCANAIAARVNGDVVNLYPASGGFDVLINNETLSGVGTLTRALAGGGSVKINGGSAIISWPDRSSLTFSGGYASLLAVYARSGHLEGLLGNYDGDISNDLRVRNGEVIADDWKALHAEYRDSWHVPFGSVQSLFKRGPDLWDPTFPGTGVGLSDFDQSAVNAARTTCTNAGVTDAKTLENCALDIVATDDNVWAAVAAKFDPTKATIIVAPALSYLVPGGSRTYSASVTGLPSKAVTWSASGGSIAATGVNSATYTAPNTSGTFTITAKSVNNGAIVSTAVVIVDANSVPGPITPGITHGGHIATAGQQDRWTFIANAGDYASVAVGRTENQSPNFAPRVRLFAPNGIQVNPFQGVDQSSWSAREFVTVPNTGTYTVIVNADDASPNSLGDYRLTLLKLPGAIAISDGDQGGALSTGTAETGNLFSGDLDTWTFTASQGESAVVTVRPSNSPGFIPLLQIIGPAASGDRRVGVSTGFTNDELEVKNMQAGVYTVITYAAYNTSSDGGTYVLTLNKTAANKPPVPSISGPAPYELFVSGQLVQFTGSGIDAEDGELPNAALSWTSSLDGPIGTGKTLSITSLSSGVHTITLTATDSRGTAAAKSVAVTVTKASTPGVVVPGATYGARGTITPQVWTFDGRQGESVLVSAGSMDAAMTVRLRDNSTGNTVFLRTSTVAQFGAILPSTGSYTIEVQSPASAFYRLTLVRSQAQHVVTGGDQGGPLTKAVTTRANLYSGDIDVWTFEAKAGETANLTLQRTGTFSADFNPGIGVVYDASGNIAPSTGDVRSVQLTNLKAGVYSVVVLNPVDSPNPVGAGEYTITLGGSIQSSSLKSSVPVKSLPLVKRPL